MSFSLQNCYFFIVAIMSENIKGLPSQRLSNIQYSVMLTMVLMLYIRFPERIHLISESAVPLKISPHFPHPQPLATTSLLSMSRIFY